MNSVTRTWRNGVTSTISRPMADRSRHGARTPCPPAAVEGRSTAGAEAPVPRPILPFALREGPSVTQFEIRKSDPKRSGIGFEPAGAEVGEGVNNPSTPVLTLRPCYPQEDALVGVARREQPERSRSALSGCKIATSCSMWRLWTTRVKRDSLAFYPRVTLEEAFKILQHKVFN